MGKINNLFLRLSEGTVNGRPSDVTNAIQHQKGILDRLDEIRDAIGDGKIHTSKDADWPIFNELGKLEDRVDDLIEKVKKEIKKLEA